MNFLNQICSNFKSVCLTAALIRRHHEITSLTDFLLKLITDLIWYKFKYEKHHSHEYCTIESFFFQLVFHHTVCPWFLTSKLPKTPSYIMLLDSFLLLPSCSKKFLIILIHLWQWVDHDNFFYFNETTKKEANDTMIIYGPNHIIIFLQIFVCLNKNFETKVNSPTWYVI